MLKNELINSLSVEKQKFSHTHTTGRVLSFSTPCIGYVIKGSAQFLYRGKTITANEGALIYISAATKYYSIWSGNPDIEFYSFNFSHFNSNSFSDYRFQILENYEHKDYLDLIYEYYEKSPMKSAGYMYLLLCDLFEKMKKHTHPEKSTCVNPAIEYIEAHFSENISIETLAKLCNCSEPHFYSVFKKRIGVSPITYKHSVLIQHALYELEHTTLSIDEISEKLGFSSSNYFRKVFMKMTGTNPNSVRTSRA